MARVQLVSFSPDQRQAAKQARIYSPAFRGSPVQRLLSFAAAMRSIPASVSAPGYTRRSHATPGE